LIFLKNRRRRKEKEIPRGGKRGRFAMRSLYRNTREGRGEKRLKEEEIIDQQLHLSEEEEKKKEKEFKKKEERGSACDGCP